MAKKRVRDEYESLELDIDSPEVKRLRDNLLDSLDDDPEICASNQDLDSFMKSFEEEITASPSAAAVRGGASGESRPDLGYLLGASDDELGIPPPTTSSSPGELGAELVRVESDSSEFGGEFWEIPDYDAFGSGLGEAGSYNGEYPALDGLFDYSDMGLGSGDYPWRPETLPAQ
ncbi:hypothetical protein PHJA_000677600 [Phtheirospermum japonicum]|uniref:Uncharacterized protein n=1 Tax=Phtheirospermum japonicum TaxID=374723 RepID=A0A830BIU3_9LAMI|nr:hypothetical protein PHJA_000677600 [Phtheirospermum japonicum]